MDEEYQAHIDNGTWKFVDLPKNIRPIDCKLTFKTKRVSLRNIDRYKVQLFVKVCS